MEQYTYLLSGAIGFLITWLTQLAKKLSFVSNPVVKFVIVGILSGGFAIGIGWLTMPELVVKDVFQQGAIMGLTAILGKTLLKTKNGG